MLEGLDGVRKMSKSYHNYVSITDSPNDIFGKIMSIPDSLIIKYYRLCTDLSSLEIKDIQKRLESGANPRDIKAKLAKEIVTMYHSEKDAFDAEKEFEKVFKKGGIPEDIETYKLEGKIWIVKLLQNVGFATSGNEARRLITQSAVELDGEIIKDINYEVERGGILRVGKRRFIKII